MISFDMLSTLRLDLYDITVHLFQSDQFFFLKVGQLLGRAMIYFFHKTATLKDFDSSIHSWFIKLLFLLRSRFN